jgi:hypothetical protein
MTVCTEMTEISLDVVYRNSAMHLFLRIQIPAFILDYYVIVQYKYRWIKHFKRDLHCPCVRLIQEQPA